MAKRYYWLKLKNDFFRGKHIKMLRKIAGGDTYTIIYLKMIIPILSHQITKIIFLIQLEILIYRLIAK